MSTLLLVCPSEPDHLGAFLHLRRPLHGFDSRFQIGIGKFAVSGGHDRRGCQKNSCFLVLNDVFWAENGGLKNHPLKVRKFIMCQPSNVQLNLSKLKQSMKKRISKRDKNYIARMINESVGHGQKIMILSGLKVDQIG